MPVRRPLVGITAAFMIGLTLGRHLPFSANLLLVAGWLVWLAFMVVRSVCRPRATPWGTGLLLIVVMLFGWMRGIPSTMPEISTVLQPGNTKMLHVYGTVAADPREVRVSSSTALRFPLRCRRITTADGAQREVQGGVDVLWYGDRLHGDAPAFGQAWRFYGALSDLKSDRLPRGCRLVTNWDRSERQQHSVFDSLLQACLALRAGAAQILRKGVKDYPGSYGLVQALLLGYRSELPEAEQRLFVRTGTLHVFAVSGLHVGIVVALLVFALRAVSLPRALWVFVAIPVLAGYTFATGLKPSAVRASVMAITFLGASCLRRRPDSISALAFAGLVLLSVSPSAITSVSFVLSFSVVGGILLLFPPLYAWVTPLWAQDPFSIARETGMMRAMRGFKAKFLALGAVSVAAWLVSAPLIGFYFGRVAPIGLVANVVVVPMAFLIVLSGSLSVSIGLYVGVASDLFNHASLALTTLLMWMLKGLAMVPGGCVEVGMVPRGVLVLWYSVIGLVLLYVYGRWRSSRLFCYE